MQDRFIIFILHLSLEMQKHSVIFSQINSEFLHADLHLQPHSLHSAQKAATSLALLPGVSYCPCLKTSYLKLICLSRITYRANNSEFHLRAKFSCVGLMGEQQQEQVVHTFTKAVSTIFARSEIWLSSVRFDAWIGDVRPGNLEIIYKFKIRDLLTKGKKYIL